MHDSDSLSRTAASSATPPSPSSGAASEPIAPSGAAALSPRARGFTLAGVLVAMLLAALDQTIVATAGPAMQADLGIPAALYAWITTAYLVASTVFVPVYGKLSDRYGRKPVLLAGILIFLLGSLLCGVAPNTTVLLLARSVQGIGSASLFTSAFAVIADLFPPAVRGRYTGLFGAVFGLASVVGPLVGGFITDTFGWHWVFFINLPVGAVAIGFVALKMPRFGASPRAGRPPLDVLGALALVFGVVPLLLAVSLGRGESGPGGVGFPWLSLPILGLFAVALTGIVAFFVVERRARDPILDLRLFRNPVFAWGNAGAFIAGSSFLGGIVFLPLFMVNVVGLSATSSGLTLMPLTFGLIAGNVLSGQLVTRLGRYKPLMLTAIGLLMTAFATIAFTLSAETSQAGVTARMVLLGIGLGPAVPLYTLAIQNGVPPDRLGVATASATFFRQMGASVGIALLGSVFASGLGTATERALAEAERTLPAGVREALHAGALAGGAPAAEDGGPPPAAGAGLEPATVEARLRAAFAQERRRAEALPPGARSRVLTELTAAEANSAATAARVSAGMKGAFAEAVRLVFVVALALAAVGFFITLPLPELPLRRTTGAAPPPNAE